MNIRKREESLEQLSQMLKQEQMKKLITQGYSDVSLSVIADFKRDYALNLADSRFYAETMNKLTQAYVQNKIDREDVFTVINYSSYDIRNEPYVDEFLDSIDEGINHETAAKTFAAVNYEDCSYAEAIGLVKSGGYKPSEYASLSVTADVAAELADMGVELRGCSGFNNCYDVTDINQTIKNGDAVFVENKYLAVMVRNLKGSPDWEQFKASAKDVLGDEMKSLTGSRLAELHDDYVRENKSCELFDKVKAEYDCFIADMKSSPADVIIGSAYEIVSKDNITMYCEEYTPDLTEKQYDALLSSSNTLDEVYEQWCKNGELHELDDIPIALEETADRLQASIDRAKEREPIAQKPVIAEPVPEQKSEQTIKSKNKVR